ncbi:alpha/beta fold hydrolase, partial [Streptomyces sp. SID6139]|nr:hypothetical protein [Streptomyces sp. SID6139]
RTDHQMKIRGFRVEPGEIEAVLGEHPAVRGCAVLLRGERLVAYVVTADDGAHATGTGTGTGADTSTDSGTGTGAEELVRHARALLPDHMVPSAWVLLDALPLTPNGKLDRAALPAPDPAGVLRQSPPEPPRDATEARIAGIWEQLLDAGPVGVHDDFFACGGHSIDALRLIGRLNDAFGERLSVSTVLERPTVAGQAEVLRAQRRSSGPDPVVRIRPDGDLDPLFLVHPIGGQVLCYRDLAAELDPGRPVFGLTAPGLTGAGPDEDDRTPATVEELAAAHLAALRQVRPEGPYHLAGWSFGGLLAYEMAHQLRAAGERVGTLTMLDTAYPRAVDVPDDDVSLLEWFHDDLARSSGTDPGPDARAALRAELRAAAGTTARLRVVADHLPDAGPDFDDLVRHYTVFRTGLLATVRYRPPVAPGPVHFHQSLTGAEIGAARRWAERVPDGLIRYDADADHYQLVRPPRVFAVAAALDAALAAADHR